MSNKTQIQRYRGLQIWNATVASTADRDTKYNDLQVNDYSWKMDNYVLAARLRKARTDIIL